MTNKSYSTALIVGAGVGISASLARLFSKHGVKVAVAARDSDKLSALATEIGGRAFPVDARDASQVKRLFRDATHELGEPDVIVAENIRGDSEEREP